MNAHIHVSHSGDLTTQDTFFRAKGVRIREVPLFTHSLTHFSAGTSLTSDSTNMAQLSSLKMMVSLPSWTLGIARGKRFFAENWGEGREKYRSFPRNIRERLKFLVHCTFEWGVKSVEQKASYAKSKQATEPQT